LLQYPDVRIQSISLTMNSSGILVGSWDNFRWKHIILMENDDDPVIAAKTIVYRGEFDHQ
jgi:hypothetical protein